jgi:predicted DCC family thiol-disulfide oxidoreductase YuxK
LIAPKPLLVYDGVCNLCAAAVRFLNAIDHKHVVQYVAFQRLTLDEIKNYGLNTAELEGQMHVVRGDRLVMNGAAAIGEVCRTLAPIISLCDLLNTPLAQRLYDFVARRRYRLFGCRDSCYVPIARGR